MATVLDLLRIVALPDNILAVAHEAGDTDYLSFVAEQKARLWARVAGLPVDAQPWPDPDKMDAVVLQLPTNRDSLSLCLAASCAILQPKGTLYLFGLNETGIKSADKALGGYFDEVELLGIGGHGRLYAARQPKRSNYKLQDFQQEALLTLPSGAMTMQNYPGLFAKGKLDTATVYLLENLPPIPAQAKVLDFACGIGVIAKAIGADHAVLADNDALAIAATQLNLPQAQFQCVAMPADISGTYDLILSNPPIHKGQKLSYDIVEALIAELPRLLAPDGACYIVAQVTVPVIKFATQKKLAATEVAANKSFRVTKITR